jgi:esterase/lipase superfamily enzyme
MRQHHLLESIAIGLAAVAFLAGCQEPLMPTPVIYHDARFNPCDFVPPKLRTTQVPVFYATNRPAGGAMDDRRYSNGVSDDIHFGESTVEFGPRGLTWEQLSEASGEATRRAKVTTRLARVRELGALPESTRPPKGPSEAEPLSPEARAFVDAIDAYMETSGARQIMIYVHGAKVDFSHACILSGELHHFLARAGAAVAFAWPTGQSLVSYGSDVKRGRESGVALARLLDLLRHTTAETIDIVSYSAGARVLAGGLVALREAYGALDEAALRREFRIDDVLFAAADISTERFAGDLLPSMYDVPRSIQVTISDRDGVLSLAKKFHGSSRLGRPDAKELSEEVRADVRQRDKLFVIDTTYSESERKLAIPGHGYWFRHPWAATDTLVTLRFEVAPGERGLLPVGPEYPRVWYIPPDYPDRIVIAVLESMSLPADATAEQVGAWIRERGRQ